MICENEVKKIERDMGDILELFVSYILKRTTNGTEKKINNRDFHSFLHLFHNSFSTKQKGWTIFKNK